MDIKLLTQLNHVILVKLTRLKHPCRGGCLFPFPSPLSASPTSLPAILRLFQNESGNIKGIMNGILTQIANSTGFSLRREVQVG